MDGSRFDTWTRRRLGFAAGGIAASVLSLTALDAAGKKKGKKKNTCRKILETCSTGGSGSSCCGKLNCDIVGDTGLRCCLGLRNSCTPADNRCCSHLNCAGTTLSIDPKCCAKAADPCEGDGDCCAEAICNGGLCVPV